MDVRENRSDEHLITELIERWAAAIRAGDLKGVLADHADDIVMFDVPPPQEGVRGIDAYRDVWPPFFTWIDSGAVFEIETIEVTAGAKVAFAHLLLRCGMPEDLAQRLRITVGLRKESGRWVVTHEHHSFPVVTEGPAAEREIRALHQNWFDATAARDLDGLMAAVADDVISYEHIAPLQYAGLAQVRQVCQDGLEAGGAEPSWTVPDLTVTTAGDLAVAWGLNRVRFEGPDGKPAEDWSRGTRVFRRTGTTWSMVHQHLSYPFDPETGAARTDLTP